VVMRVFEQREYVGYMRAAWCGLAVLLVGCSEPEQPTMEYAGSESCRECHEKFYKLWAPSHHGKALQPWSAELAADVPAQATPIEVEGALYQATITPERGWVTEDGKHEYDIAYAIGGKNLYNFLTLLPDGRLQVLPILYDKRQKKWESTTASMLRHFDDGRQDVALPWRDSMLTFNAACFSCHVSQIDSNYDPETDTYATTWNEPGISCESCHGPSSEHIRVCREGAASGVVPADMKLISWKKLSVQQQNDSCSGCHSKGIPISDGFETGENYWDHYDLTTFEHQDYYSDGRDLGENYTLGSWLLSPCVTKGGMSCTHCHTSSGRYRFKGEKANDACLPCHKERVAKGKAHMHHTKKNGATECIQCHMPMNPFGGMNQTDHSMRPPMPNLSKAFGSRNACIMCHKDKDHDWALARIVSWHPDFKSHTAGEMAQAKLVDDLRKGSWTALPAAKAFIADPASDPLFVATLIRLLPPTNDPRQHAMLSGLVANAPHPLVRASAAAGLDADNNAGDRAALFTALGDEIRLVRIRAAERLAAVPEGAVPPASREAYDSAIAELWQSHNLRLDHWSSHFNGGNILMRQDKMNEAAAKYDRAHELRSDIAPPLINAAMAFANLGNLVEAERRLLKATVLPEPSAAAHFNLGLLYAEQGRNAEAEKALYKALELDPRNGTAACNLAILVAGKNMPEAVRLLQLAIKADPLNPRNPQTLAYYYLQAKQFDEARRVINEARRRGVSSRELEAMRRDLR
jgi:tetratricopeptide (TPR) repeat protein